MDSKPIEIPRLLERGGVVGLKNFHCLVVSKRSNFFSFRTYNLRLLLLSTFSHQRRFIEYQAIGNLKYKTIEADIEMIIN